MSGVDQAGGTPALPKEQHWSPELFVFDPRGEATRERPALLDLTGPPRALVYGPYVTLPPGNWRAQILFMVDECGCQRRFRVEWGGLSAFASHTFIPGKPGIFRAELEHSWSGDTVAEARIILTESAIEGMLELVGVTVSALR